MNVKNKQYGFTLIELMVGMIIGLIVSGIVITTFMQSKRNYSQDEKIARLQENGRFALQLLTKEISMAGFAGNMQIEDTIDVSSPLTEDATDACGIDWWKIIDKPVTVLPDSSSLNCISGEKSGTNIVIFIRVEGKSTTSPTAGKLYFGTNGRGGEIIADGSVKPDYTYWPYVMHIYYVKEATSTVPLGLYRKRLTYSSGLEMTSDGNIVPGFFAFGSIASLDTNDDGVADKYASSVSAVSGMVGLRMDILMTSETEVFGYTNDKTYTLGGEAVSSPGSKYFGRVFSTTVPLRNTAFRNAMSSIGE